MNRENHFLTSSQRDSKPFFNLEDINRIRKTLSDKPRDLLLFDLATQTGVKMKELLGMKVADLIDLEVGEALPIAKGNAKKTFQPVIITETIYETFQSYLDEVKPERLDYLFKSRKGSNPLNISSVSNMISGWFKGADVQGITGVRALRKIWELYYRHNAGNRKENKTRDSIPFLGPVQRTTLQETVYQELLQAIVSGKIPPGGKLTTKNIAQQMKVSEMPVREALGRLAAGGFISMKKKKSSVVKELSKDNLMEIMEIRLALETIAVEKACLARREATLERLEAIHQEYMKATDEYDVDEILRFNKVFHHTIYRDADMPILQRIIEGLWDQISPYLHILMRESYFPYKELNARNHGRILEGLKHKDLEKAVKWLKTDLREAANFILMEFERSKV